jgi:hypothetical protein
MVVPMVEKAPARYDVLPMDDPELKPEQPVPGVDLDRQVESMLRLRAMHNEIPNGYAKRDRQMQAWALSNSLSRHDMARAIGVHKTRVDQIVRELTLLDQERSAREALDRLRRHMPEELFREALRQQPELAQYYEDMGETFD